MRKPIQLKVPAMILAAAILICIVLTVLLFLRSSADRLRPVENQAIEKWATFGGEEGESTVENYYDDFTITD